MKRGAPEDTKMFWLAEYLGVPQVLAVGIMECLWQWTANHAPTGLLTAEAVPVVFERLKGHQLEYAFGIDARSLVHSLKRAGWLDPPPGISRDEWSSKSDAASVIHGWYRHCEDSVHIKLARAIECFASGERPRMHRLSKDERERIEASYVAKEESRAHAVRTESAQPTPTPLPLPMPMPAAAPEEFSTTVEKCAHENRESENENQTPKTKTPRIGEREFKRRIERRDFAPREAEIVLSAENRAFWERVAGDESAPYAERELARDALARAGEPMVGRKPPGKEAPDREPGAAHG